MGDRLYVGNLPFDTSEQQLTELFSPHGQVVSVKLITDKMTGRSRDFGFVEMGTEAEGQVAIDKMNGTTVGSRQIVVNKAKPMEDRGGGGGSRGGDRGGWGGGGRGGDRGGGGGGRGGGGRY